MCGMSVFSGSMVVIYLLMLPVIAIGAGCSSIKKKVMSSVRSIRENRCDDNGRPFKKD